MDIKTFQEGLKSNGLLRPLTQAIDGSTPIRKSKSERLDDCMIKSGTPCFIKIGALPPPTIQSN